MSISLSKVEISVGQSKYFTCTGMSLILLLIFIFYIITNDTLYTQSWQGLERNINPALMHGDDENIQFTVDKVIEG